MPILKTLPSWPNPQESIGRQIPSSRVGRRKVWYSRGPAQETFEKAIQPEIENNLKQLDLGRAEMFIRLYMIGRNSENANPIVMICCTNKKARDAAEATIRESGLLEEYKGFGLGAIVFPLEHPARPHNLSPRSQGHSFSAEGSRSDSAVTPSPQMSSFPANLSFNLPPNTTRRPPADYSTPYQSPPLIIDVLETAESSVPDTSAVIFASSTDPQLGRRIFSPTRNGEVSNHYATAGIVVKVGDNYYQLTAGHLFEIESETLDTEPFTNLDECHFDGQSVDGEHDSDYESDITGRGSATPEDARSRDGSSNSDSTNEKNDSFRVGMLQKWHKIPSTLNQRSLLPYRSQKPTGTGSMVRTNPVTLKHRFPVGHLPQGRVQPPMDYALIALPRDSVKKLGKNINTPQAPYPPVKDVAKVGREECSIIVVTTSTIIRGTLIPGKIAYRGSRAHRFESLVQIALESELFEGDCGSPVLDESTGSLYGHIIMGVAGTKVAYIVQAVDIFHDINKRTGQLVYVVTKEKEDGVETMSPLTTSRVSTSRARSNAGGRRRYWSSSASYGASVFSQSSSGSASTRMSAPDIDVAGYVAAGSLPCEFVGYGECEVTFDIHDTESWIEHIILHHLQDMLPKKLVCWFCNDYTFEAKRTSERRQNFEDRMYHIREHFLTEERTVNHMQPDYHFNTHLQNSGLISEESYNAVRRYNEVSQPPWMLAHDEIPPDLPARDSRDRAVYHDPDMDERHYRRERHRSGKTRK
ncbi:hypothetical protein ANO14919_011580 [Xylariales sp. No.14919]|nr:hypothetical protein ANO14919_011580 [Xylariales sp. No.14919]